MRPTRARLAAGAAALVCLLGIPGPALADKPDDTGTTDQPPPAAEQPQDHQPPARDEERGRGDGEDGGSQAPPEAFIPTPPPEFERPAEPRQPREPRRRERSERRAAPTPPPRPAAEPPDPAPRVPAEPEPAAPRPEPAPRDESRRRRERVAECARRIERGEEFVTIRDLCAGDSGGEAGQRNTTRSASATGSVRNAALLGALALLSVFGLRILALRSRDPRA